MKYFSWENVPFADFIADCVHGQWFLSPCSDFHDRIMFALNAFLPESLKITGTQCWLVTLSVAHRDFFRITAIWKCWGTFPVYVWGCYAHWIRDLMSSNICYSVFKPLVLLIFWNIWLLHVVLLFYIYFSMDTYFTLFCFHLMSFYIIKTCFVTLYFILKNHNKKNSQIWDK